MTHGPHEPILEAGLADGCERCDEIANDPFIGLDDDNLRALILRTYRWMRDSEFPRSHNENRAMRIVETSVRRAEQIKRLAERTPA